MLDNANEGSIVLMYGRMSGSMMQNSNEIKLNIALALITSTSKSSLYLLDKTRIKVNERLSVGAEDNMI